MSCGIRWCVIVSVMRRCWNDSVRHTLGRRPTVWTTDRLNDCRPTRRVRSVGGGGGDGGDWERPPRSHTPFFFLSFRSVPFRFFRARISYPSPPLSPPPPDVRRPSATAARVHVPPAFERRRWPSRSWPKRSRSDLVERYDTIIISQIYVFNVTLLGTYILYRRRWTFRKIFRLSKHPFSVNNSRRG